MGQFPSYQTPQHDQQIFLAPAWNQLVAQLDPSTSRAAGDSVSRDRRPAEPLAARARQEALAAAYDYTRGYSDVERPTDGPLVFTGHQPELVHPGVWLKNFLAARLARHSGGVAVNLVIDCDRCVRPAIDVPAGDPAHPRRAAVFYDQMLAPLPYEERRLADPTQWDRFAANVAATMASYAVDPLVTSWWPETIAIRQSERRLGHIIAKARHRTEQQWGVASLQLPQSLLCQTHAFRRFVIEAVDRCQSFRVAYNGALAEYRRQHRIRNDAQPLPNLAVAGEMVETPFWAYRAETPVRRALYARRQGNEVVLSDLADLSFAVPVDAGRDYVDACEVLAQQERRGVKIRSRALATTLYVRRYLADLFIHGIGGGKYDQATDLLSQRFFGTAPPPFAVASGTLRLGIALPEPVVGPPSNIRRRLRELAYHPETFLTDGTPSERRDEAIAAAVAAKQEALAMSPGEDHGRSRHARIVDANGRLNALLSPVRAELEQTLEIAERQQRARAVLDSREYAFCLYSRERLRTFLLDRTF